MVEPSGIEPLTSTMPLQGTSDFTAEKGDLSDTDSLFSALFSVPRANCLPQFYRNAGVL